MKNNNNSDYGFSSMSARIRADIDTAAWLQAAETGTNPDLCEKKIKTKLSFLSIEFGIDAALDTILMYSITGKTSLPVMSLTESVSDADTTKPMFSSMNEKLALVSAIKNNARLYRALKKGVRVDPYTKNAQQLLSWYHEHKDLF